MSRLYPPPFGNIPVPLCGIGRRDKHSKAAERAVKIRANTSKVADYHDPPGADIAPYERPVDNPGATCYAPPDCSVGNPKCGFWPLDERLGGESAWPNNTFAAPELDTTVDITTAYGCQKIGFKSVQAWKTHHGRAPYTCEGAMDTTFDCCNALLAPQDIAYEPYRANATTAKYLREIKAAHFLVEHYFDNSGSWELDSSVEGNATYDLAINRYSGQPTGSIPNPTPTLNKASDSWDAGQTADAQTNAANTAFGLLGTTVTNNLFRYSDVLITEDGTVTWQDTRDVNGAGTLVVMTISRAANHFYFWSDSKTYVRWWNGTAYETVLQDHEFREVTGDLSNLYDASDVLDDIVTLLGQWPLNDDIIYPFRTDGALTMGPFVMYHEPRTPINPKVIFETFETPVVPFDVVIDDDGSGGGLLATSGTAINPFTGDIRGAPKVLDDGTVFPDYIFNYDQKNFVVCGFPERVWENDSCGRKNVDDGMPRTATQWTNKYDSQFFYPAEFYLQLKDISTNNGPGLGILAQKYCQTKQWRTSVNFARPAGLDKFSWDERNVYFVTSIVGSDVHLEDSQHNSVSLPAFSGQIWGGADVNGFYECSCPGGVDYVTLGTKRFNNVPTGFGDGFGKLRFPDSPGIIGRVKISSVDNAGGTPHLNTATLEKYLGLDLLNDENIDVYDHDMNLLAGNQKVTRISDGQFSVPVSYATVQNAKWITYTGAPLHWWNNSEPKGTYSVLKFGFNYRDMAEYDRLEGQYDYWVSVRDSSLCPDCDVAALPRISRPRGNQIDVFGYPQEVSSIVAEDHCLSFSECDPAVICCSPNSSDVFPNGNRHSCIDDFVPDGRYGARAQMEIYDEMEDPFWQPPHRPQDMDDWREDNGSCSKEYPQRPWREMRTVLPSGAPALPAEIFIRVMTVSDMATGSTYNGKQIFPRTAPTFFDTNVGGSWTIYIAEKACVCANGTFAESYRADGVICDQPE